MSDNSKPYKSQWPLRYVMDSELINSKLLGVLLILAISGCSPATSTDINQHTDASSVSTSSTSIAKHSDPDMTYPTHLAKRFPRLPDIAATAPVARRIEHSEVHHGLTLTDPYHWLKDQGYPEVNDEPVLDYLNAENDYYQTFLASHKPLVETLFAEYKGRVDPTDVSVPFTKHGYEYRYEYLAEGDYRTLIRKNLANGGEQVYLDQPALAKGQDYFVLGDYDISPDNNHMAYSLDTKGDERYTIYFKDLRTGKISDVKFDNTSGDVLFVNNGQGIVYGELHADRWATKSINYYDTVTQQITVLQTEANDEFSLGFSSTSDEQFLLIYSGTNDVTEISAVNLEDVTRPVFPLVSREQGFNAQIDHAHGQFYILTNDTHVNSRLAAVSSAQPDYAKWQTLLEGSDTQYLKSLQTFNFGVVLHLSRNALEAIAVMPYDEQPMYDVDFAETVYDVSLGTNPEFDTATLRVNYESMITPMQVIDIDVATQTQTIRKQQAIPSGYTPSDYVTERIMAPARDGAQIPISIVYHKSFKPDGTAPLLLYAYGAYGVSMSPNFSTTRLSLLDRGFAFAIAHTRGGDEMGYQWYLDGKMEKRQNAFNDFVDVAQHLVDKQYTHAGNISIMGASAGGKMMGAAITMAPNMWRSVILDVPFVDVLNTMLDASLPLTPPEWSEWGNPISDKTAFETILSYSPYEQIQVREYPPMMVTGGLNDPRVTYWEPAKWTAKMRHRKTDKNLLVMRMNMSAGHFANSGRYGRLLDIAEEYAFILTAHGINQ